MTETGALQTKKHERFLFFYVTGIFTKLSPRSNWPLFRPSAALKALTKIQLTDGLFR